MESSVKHSNIKAVAFDFDGVITNLDVDWKAAIQLASKIAGYDVKSLITFYEVSWGTPVFQKVSEEIEKTEVQAMKKAEPKPFIKGFLQTISESNIQTYVVTMQSATAVNKFLELHDLEDCFKEIITREKCPNRKAQVRYIIEKLKIDPKEILLVDDSERNISICKELGIACYHFSRHQNPNKTKKSWSQISKIVKNPI